MTNSTWLKIRYETDCLVAAAAQRLNVGVSSEMRKNFVVLDDAQLRELREALEENYLPEKYDPEDRDDHLYLRTNIDRYSIVPWINHSVPLRGRRVLEVGCGTGSSTVALAEQGAELTGLDLHAGSLSVAETRCRLHGFPNVRLVQANAQELAPVFEGEKFSLIIFFATLEHMTIEERRSAISAAWSLLEEGGHICVTETPNRLWFYDSHTSWLPFFNWLPDDLAIEYASRSPRSPFNQEFRDNPADLMKKFLRYGRGMSFHEFDLELGGPQQYSVVSDLNSYLARRNPAKLLKRVLSGDGRRERLLNSYEPARHRAFFREYLDLILRKRAN